MVENKFQEKDKSKKSALYLYLLKEDSFDLLTMELLLVQLCSSYTDCF